MNNDYVAIVQNALAYAAKAETSVRAAALIHLARVVAVDDRIRALLLLNEGIELIDSLSADQRQIVAPEALPFIAAVDPGRAVALSSSFGIGRGISQSHRLIVAMLGHGHLQKVASMLCEPSLWIDYPLESIGAVIIPLKDPGKEVEILQTAIAVWLNRQPALPGRPNSNMFLHILTTFWDRLPAEEAVDSLRKIVHHLLNLPDQPISAGVQHDNELIRFSSTREYNLFVLLKQIQESLPERVNQFMNDYPQLAAAAERMPLGFASFPKATGVMCGVQQRPAQSTASLEADLRSALRFYNSEIASGNQAALEGWESTQTFRELLYAAGKENVDSQLFLDRISNQDIRMLASIELAAALADLPEMRGGRHSYHPRN